MEKIELNKIEGTPSIKHSQATTVETGGRVSSISNDLPNHEKGGNKNGWGSMIFNFLKILIFGACVFLYDIISKNFY